MAKQVPFRAGRDEITDGIAAASLPSFTGEYTLLCDISEFQPEIADAAYLNWSKAIVIRAAYGAQHDDRAWYGGQRRALLHDGGVAFLGIYQYVVAAQDAAAQARALAALLGSLQSGEKVIADIEEGAGSAAQRWADWAAVISGELGDDPWDYSGMLFAAAHGLAPVDWVAAYGQSEPLVPHVMWQFTDAYAVPGVGTADCSVFHGTIASLAALAWGGVPPSWTEVLMSELPTLAQGATGPDVRSVQGLLCARGHPVSLDGDYGPATASAVAAFQAAAGFTGADVDGITGPQTWPKLLCR